MSRFGWSARSFAIILLTSAACGEATPPVGGGNLPSRVVITPGQARLAAVGDTTRLRAGLYDDYGNPLTSGAVVWSSLDPQSSPSTRRAS